MEIIDLLINSSIAFVAVDIAVYTISVSLLGSQLKMNVIYIKRRLDETEEKIKSIQKDSKSSSRHLSEIQAELNRFKEEEENFRSKLFCLNVKGAVFYPCVFFAVSFSFAILAQYIAQIDYAWLVFIGFSGLTMFLGIFRIGRTLQAVDFAATNVPLPDFDVNLGEDDEKTITLAQGKTQTVRVSICNIGYDIGEVVELSLFFPPDFLVEGTENEDVGISIQPSSSDYPEHTGASFSTEFLHVNSCVWFEIQVKPTKAGTYRIDAYVAERKIAETEFELKIIVK